MLTAARSSARLLILRRWLLDFRAQPPARDSSHNEAEQLVNPFARGFGDAAGTHGSSPDDGQHCCTESHSQKQGNPGVDSTSWGKLRETSAYTARASHGTATEVDAFEEVTSDNHIATCIHRHGISVLIIEHSGHREPL